MRIVINVIFLLNCVKFKVQNRLLIQMKLKNGFGKKSFVVSRLCLLMHTKAYYFQPYIPSQKQEKSLVVY